MLNIDWTLPIVMVMFLVFAVLMNKLFFSPVTQTLAARRAHIKDQQDRATAALAEAQALQADYVVRLRAAQGQAAEAIQSALLESEGRRQVLLDGVRGQVALEVEAARVSIQQEHDTAVASIAGELGGFSDAIKRKIMGGAPALSSTGGYDS